MPNGQHLVDVRGRFYVPRSQGVEKHLNRISSCLCAAAPVYVEKAVEC